MRWKRENVMNEGGETRVSLYFTMHTERFERAIDILVKTRETLQKQMFTDFSYSEYVNSINQQYNAQREAQIADIDDALNNLYAIREVCPNKEQ